MKKIIGFLGITALLLFLAPEPKVEGQIGYQITAAQLSAAFPLTTDTQIAADDTIVWWGDGASGDASFVWASATNIMDIVVGSNDSIRIRDANTDWSFVLDENVAGTSWDIAVLTATLKAMNGSDTIRGLFVDLTNANHTSTSNLLYGIDIDGITGDADATESAIHIGEGWDYEIEFENTTTAVIAFADNRSLVIQDKGANSGIAITDGGLATSVFSVEVATFNAPMNGGGDKQTSLFIDHLNSNHTGSGNTYNSLEIDAIVGDADAVENIFYFGDGFDYFLNDQVDTALGTLTWTTNSDKTGNAKSGTLKVFINNTLYHIQLYADS